MKILRVVKNFFFSTKLYNYYLLKNDIKDISFTPKDSWPGNPVLGDELVQGYYNIANKMVKINIDVHACFILHYYCAHG